MDTANDTRLTFLCAVAVHAEIEELVPQFTRQHGIAVDVNYDVNPAVAKRVMAGEDFDAEYDEIQGDAEFHPAGKTEDAVLEFLAANPDQVDRVKQEERDGASRKGILNYDVQ